MSRRPSASLPHQDEDSWRLPDWEAFSESGRSAWTDHARESDVDSVDTDDGRRARWPARSPAHATVTASKARLVPLPVADLKALHMRFAQEREQAAAAAATTVNDVKNHEQQAMIAAQLQSVREQLREFQQKWQARADADTQPTTATAMAPTTATAMAPTALSFDVAMQTDLEFGEDALRQWIHLITDKAELLAASFHHKTTQLPLTYPLQSHLERPFSVPKDEDAAASVASWHVGGSLKSLVGEATASRLLDLERAVACLATATTETTHRYVAYFEDIVVKIQDLHQQRLRQVVEESLHEMKSQRAKYKKRAEQLEAELERAKEEAARWREQATSTHALDTTEKAKLEAVVAAQQAEWAREKAALRQELERVQQSNAQLSVEKTSADATAATLRQQLATATDRLRSVEQQGRQSVEAARSTASELRGQLQRAHATIDRLELSQGELRDDLRRTQHQLARAQDEAAAIDQHRRQALDELNRVHATALEEKRAVPECADAGVQATDEEDADDRSARLKKRCRALESLLDKKFEDSSQASVDSGRWSSVTGGGGGVDGLKDASRTLPLTLSLSSSVDGDTSQLLHRAEEDEPVWGTASTGSASRPLVPAAAVSAVRDAPSADAMLALVQKLEAIASRQQQPDSEPDLSEGPTPPKPRAAVTRPVAGGIRTRRR